MTQHKGTNKAQVADPTEVEIYVHCLTKHSE